MLLKCEDCMVTFESESLKDCPSCGTADFIYQLSDNQVLDYENQKLKKENAELLRENINMHDALDLKSEGIQELKKQLATAVKALEEIAENENVDFRDKLYRRFLSEIARKALAEIGGEDEH